MSSKSLAEEAKSVLEANTRLDEAVSGLRKRVPHADRLRGEYSPLLGEEEELVPLGAGERPNWQDRNFCRRHGLRVCGSDSAEDRLPLWHRILEVCVMRNLLAPLATSLSWRAGGSGGGGDRTAGGHLLLHRLHALLSGAAVRTHGLRRGAAHRSAAAARRQRRRAGPPARDGVVQVSPVLC